MGPCLRTRTCGDLRPVHRRGDRGIQLGFLHHAPKLVAAARVHRNIPLGRVPEKTEEEIAVFKTAFKARPNRSP